MSTNLSRGIKRSALFVALGMCFAGAVQAQSNITGSIFGQAPAGAGNTVVIENLDTGLSRTYQVDADGRFRISALPNGRYKVTLQKDGAAVGVRDNVQVNIAGGTEVSFAPPGQFDTIEVIGGVGIATIDVSQTDTRTVLTAEQLSKISIQRDIASVALLAPSVVRNDSYSANGNTVPSFGGSASSENAYFINGYSVTNPLTSIGFTSLPFDAIAEQQVLTGGYGAEFGRSTGGVINVVTKRGTNEWKGGVYTIWQPEVLRASPRNTYYPVTGAYPETFPDPTRRTDGTLNNFRNQNNFWQETTGAYVGGPLMKDRLFAFANVEMQREEGARVRSTRLDAAGSAAQRAGWDEYKNELPRWLVKADWYVTDDHILEFTGVSDVTKVDSNRSGFYYNTFAHDNVQYQGIETEDNSKLYVGRYTGYLTDALTVSALYGTQKIDHDTDLFAYDNSCPRIAAATSGRAPSIPSANYNGCQRYTAAIPLFGRTLTDETRGWRLDVSYHLGDHDLRVGWERQDAESFTGTQQPGGYIWSYVRQTNPNAPIDASHGVGSPASGGNLGTTGFYVNRITQTRQADVRTVQESQYIEDRWQIGADFLLSLGLRNEQFTNYTAAGEAYISQNKQLAPRVGFSWDVSGDATFKLFGNAGRYHLVLPNNAAVRGASASLNTNQYFTYTGVDPVTAAPIGLTPIPVTPGASGVCPGTTNVISANLECGVPPNPLTTTAKDIKAHYQDEYIFGFEHALTDTFAWGAKFTYRDLKSAIDDTCAQVLGGKCRNFNPGEDNDFYIEQPGGGLALVHYTNAQLGMPKLKRKYYALDLFAEHAYANKWYGKVEYTFSRNWGNTEGQLASELDIGAGGQVDVSRTQDWDLPQLMVGSSGLLPNHRAHQLKAYGYYQFAEEWRVGTSVIMASGRPRNCTSFYPTADAGLYNGSFYWFCGLAGTGNPGAPTYVPPSADYRISTRGALGDTPNTINLNLNIAYVPAWLDGKVTLQADVLNVLNRQVAGSYNSRYSLNRTEVNPVFGQELNYSAPRSVRLTARYDF